MPTLPRLALVIACLGAAPACSLVLDTASYQDARGVDRTVADGPAFDARDAALFDARNDAPIPSDALDARDAAPFDARDATMGDAMDAVSPDVLTCPPGLTPCRGACVDTTSDTENCGSCGTACRAGVSEVAFCRMSSCGAMCAAGTILDPLLGTCIIPRAPRQIAPMSTSTVVSTRPRLQWDLQFGTTGARVQICRDRGCTTVVRTFDVAGSSAQVPEDLAAGVHFWRLTSLLLGVPVGAPGFAWQFTVGVRNAPAGTSYGTVLDVNNDGFAEVAVGAHEANLGTGLVMLYLGGAAGPVPSAPLPLREIMAARGNHFGQSIASGGDVNGDGFADLLVGAPGAEGSTGRVYVYLGSNGGPSGVPSTMLPGPFAGGEFGESVAGVGDVNRDGYGDVMVGARLASGGGAAVLYLGSAAGLVATPALTLSPPSAGGTFGESVTGAGDVNGDGFADVAVGARTAGSAGVVYTYVGLATPLLTMSSTISAPTDFAGLSFGRSVACAGDFNGDGYADLVVGRLGRAYVFGGGGPGFSTTPLAALAARDGMSNNFGYTVAGAGDVNRDGLSDVLVGDDAFNSFDGRAHVFVGSTVVPSTAFLPTITIIPGASSQGFGVAVAGAGDVNRDGFADIVVGAWRADGGDGLAYVFTRVGAGASFIVLTGPPGLAGNFGFAVASREWAGPVFR